VEKSESALQLEDILMSNNTENLSSAKLRAMADAKDKSQKEKMSEYLNTRGIIEMFFEEKNIEWGFGHYYLDGKSKTYSDIDALFREWAQEEKIANSYLKNDLVNAAHHNIEQMEMKKIRKNVSTKLQFEDNDEWKKLKSLSGFTEDDIIIYRSWVWNVKRGAAGLSQEQVPMPMLYSSAQGVYKSTFNQKIYSPVQELTECHDIKVIADQFSIHLWSKLLVVDFDEMAGFESKDITLFKSWSYARYLNGRSMFSQKTNRYLKITQCIGSSNKPIEAIIWDTTGSRRVWQVNLNQSLKETCESIDFLKLWKSVDIEADCPLVIEGNFQRIMEKQFNEQRRKSPTETFLDELLKIGLTKDRITATDLYKEYCEWSMNNNEKVKSSTSFGRDLKSLTYILEKARTSNGYYYEFKNSPSSSNNDKGLDEYLWPTPDEDSGIKFD
jgi:hypothetical protein